MYVHIICIYVPALSRFIHGYKFCHLMHVLPGQVVYVCKAPVCIDSLLRFKGPPDFPNVLGNICSEVCCTVVNPSLLMPA